MPKTRPPYPPEFKAEAVKLARSSGKLLSGLARDLGVPTETLRNWLKQEQIDTGKREGITTDEREELGRLRRENDPQGRKRGTAQGDGFFQQTSRICLRGKDSIIWTSC